MAQAKNEKVHVVPLKDIKVGNRTRKVFREVESLAVSIQNLGLICPIIVDDELNLIDGERRLRAHKMLGMKEISCIYKKDMDDTLRKEIELECNLQREPFSWQEEVSGKAELLEMKQARLGKAVKGMRVGYGLQDLADAEGQSVGQIHADIKLAKAMKEMPEIAQCKNKATAQRMYDDAQKNRVLKALTKDAETFIPSANITHGDLFIELPKRSAESVDMILVDPPYGKDIVIAAEADGEEVDTVKFDDSKFNTKEMLETMLKESFRILKPNRCMLMFFDISLYQWLIDQAAREGFNVNKTPMVWHKTSGSGHPSHDSHYVPAYELILHLQKGYRKINTTTNNIIAYDRVPAKIKTHPTQKPTGLLKLLIENHTFLGELVVDPCCGTGSTLKAALMAKRQAWGCELNEDYYNQAQKSIVEFTKRGVEKEEEVHPGQVPPNPPSPSSTVLKETTQSAD